MPEKTFPKHYIYMGKRWNEHNSKLLSCFIEVTVERIDETYEILPVIPQDIDWESPKYIEAQAMLTSKFFISRPAVGYVVQVNYTTNEYAEFWSKGENAPKEMWISIPNRKIRGLWQLEDKAARLQEAEHKERKKDRNFDWIANSSLAELKDMLADKSLHSNKRRAMALYIWRYLNS